MNTNAGQFFIGIDSGGSKCRIVIAATDMKVILKKTYTGIHYSVTGAEKYSSLVSLYIRDSLKIKNLKLKDCKGICLGIAGAREKSDRRKLKKSFCAILNFKNVLITTDAMTALYGAFEGEDGIIIISGTGSVLYGLSENKIKRVGGWGRIIGDEGSGYWIGKRALNLITKEFDGSFSQSLLSEHISNEFGITVGNVNERIFHGKFNIQDIAPAVIECAEKNCPLSLKIISEAAGDLVSHVKTFLRTTNRKNPVNIVFTGSVIENKNLLSVMLKRKLEKIKIVSVTEKKHSPEFGALLLAKYKPDILSKL